MDMDVDEQLREQESDCRDEEAAKKSQPTSLACLSTFAPSLVLDYQYLYCKIALLNESIQQLEQRVSSFSDILRYQDKVLSGCIDSLKECQQQTAKVLNHELERHALNPAIKTIVGLADELFRLNDIAERLDQGAGANAELQQLKDQLEISAYIARDKLAYLDIERIMPSKADDIDPKKHDIAGDTGTNDKCLHGKTSRLITPGIIYRGKILLPAKVSVFVYRKVNSEQNKK